MDLEEQLKQNAQIMREFEKSFQQKLAESSVTVQEIDLNYPYLMNLNEDPLLNGKSKYSLKEKEVRVGKKNGVPSPQIVLGGMGIQPNHAIFYQQDDTIILEPFNEECGEYIYVNGNQWFQKGKLEHNDRVIFGTNAIFLIKYPDRLLTAEQKQKKDDVDWEFAQQEQINKLNQLRQYKDEQSKKQREAEVELQIQEIERKQKQDKMNSESLMKMQQQAYEQKIKSLENKLNADEQKKQLETDYKENIDKIQSDQAAKELESQKEIQDIQSKDNIARFKYKEKHYIEHKLAKYLPKVLEANLIAKELKRNVTLSAKLSYAYGADDLQGQDDKSKKLKIKIQVSNKEEGCVYLWDMKKFSNRYYIIKDILDRYFETNLLPELSKEEDPFWDPPEPQLLGQGFLKLMSLVYLLDNPSDLTIVSDKGACGSLIVNLIPTDKTGEFNIGELMEAEGENIEDPMELLNKQFFFKVVIESANLNQGYWKDIFCEYKIIQQDGSYETCKTKTIKGLNKNPQFNYEKVHYFENLTEKLINYLLQSNLCFHLYGYEELDPPKMNIKIEGKQSKQVKQESSNINNEIPKEQLDHKERRQSMTFHDANLIQIDNKKQKDNCRIF